MASDGEWDDEKTPTFGPETIPKGRTSPGRHDPGQAAPSLPRSFKVLLLRVLSSFLFQGVSQSVPTALLPKAADAVAKRSCATPFVMASGAGALLTI